MEQYEATIQFKVQVTAANRDVAEYVINQAVPRHLELEVQRHEGHGRVDRIRNGEVHMIRRLKG